MNREDTLFLIDVYKRGGTWTNGSAINARFTASHIHNDFT
jgi:hypothetical protein